MKIVYKETKLIVLSMGSHRVGHNWSDLTAAAVSKGRRNERILKNHHFITGFRQGSSVGLVKTTRWKVDGCLDVGSKPLPTVWWPDGGKGKKGTWQCGWGCGPRIPGITLRSLNPERADSTYFLMGYSMKDTRSPRQCSCPQVFNQNLIMSLHLTSSLQGPLCVCSVAQSCPTL